MRLVTIRTSGGRPIGGVDEGQTGGAARAFDGGVAVVLAGGRLLTLAALAEAAPGRLPGDIGGLDLAALLTRDPKLAAIRAALETTGIGALDALALDPAGVRLAAPIPRPGKIVGVGYNYLDHIHEQGLERPARPVLFSKFASSVAADGEPIRHPAATHALDLEAELAVVIGRRARRVPAHEALRYVAGYTAANDVTARDWQGQARALRPGEKGDGQWLRAKGSDTFLPLGPVLVTADELGDGRGLSVRSWLTAVSGPLAGEPFQMQDGSSAELLFGVPDLIEIISREVTLDPGDVILTGTPSGVGVFREPSIFLAPGDLVRVEVEGIGSLTNPVTDEEGNAPTGSPAARFMTDRLAG